jgi:hypothetical protein
MHGGAGVDAPARHDAGRPPAGRRKDRMAEAYCVKDKRKVEIKDPQQITMKNGKPAVKGTCPICGTSVFKIGG